MISVMSSSTSACCQFSLSLRLSSSISFRKYSLHLSNIVLLDCTFFHMICRIFYPRCNDSCYYAYVAHANILDRFPFEACKFTMVRYTPVQQIMDVWFHAICVAFTSSARSITTITCSSRSCTITNLD